MKKKEVYKANPEKKSVKQKIQRVDEIKKELKNYSTVALIDLRLLPDALFQSIRKRIREEGGKVFVAKRAIMERVFEHHKDLKKKQDELNKPVALLLTTLTPYQLSKFFRENKKKRAAKTGEIAPFEIVVPEGETDLPPGPALSELKTAGLNVQIKGGKIVIAKASVVAKTGEAITEPKVKALQKLNIMPFEVSVNLLFASDGEYFYGKELLDFEVQQLVDAFTQARNVSLNGNLYSKSTIELLLTSAARQGMALSGLEKNKEG
ncbi:50S ribosomal protein L10 [Candidatus Micrarchaeota archaeon]|nr:50S ribosomal protein L10 [Candidatus Micrarchaeota archaeon]